MLRLDTNWLYGERGGRVNFGQICVTSLMNDPLPDLLSHMSPVKLNERIMFVRSNASYKMRLCMDQGPQEVVQSGVKILGQG